MAWLDNSNTTLVKVKSHTTFLKPPFFMNSNTTLVKVKYSSIKSHS